MRIILTHEQTDFDGIASLLAAHLLDKYAYPVLPRRMNRNVQAFITLYGEELPFVDPRDLTKEEIKSVCLVDTQSLISVKGMSQHTLIHVVDHHSPRNDIPKDWDITTEETGANTTIFIEGIQNRNIPLSVVQATLLLLGIYEDTGSLTYTRTTSKDVRAAAFLIDQGASLTLATDFLNHPLSLEQQEIYDQLRQNSISQEIHGHHVIVAPGDAREMNEELSTIAHRLRDLLDPDALFLIITIGGGVQFIARSTSDNIDVSDIAAHFGGGGHPRAAAALIKDSDRESVEVELLEILPMYIHPAITVEQIMSRDPQVLSPDTPVNKAAERMQRFGYEGYPVIENGEIVGLLTRRAVDRAITHKLNITVGSIMDAGKVSVKPDDSIERLQKKMTESGWGQIPVIGSASNDIIGIVTRTDLLKTLAPQTNPTNLPNLVERLNKALPPARITLVNAIAKIAQHRRTALFIVGGFVRDLLLDHPIMDFDIVVEGDAIALAKAVQERLGGRVKTHKRFGTAKWFLGNDTYHKLCDFQNNNQNAQTRSSINREDISNHQLPISLDLITARTEFYTHPTALPTIERGSIKLDLHRRDFTINTLALRLDGRHYGELHDYWGGLSDLRQGIVRVLHSLSFVDDPTRMLRAVRYEQRYGFQIDERTLELLLEARSMIDRVSGDRIRHELKRIIDEENAVAMFNRLTELGLLKAIHRDLTWDRWVSEKLSSFYSPDHPLEAELNFDEENLPDKEIITYILWLLRHPPSQVKSISKRLKLPSTIKIAVDSAVDLWPSLSTLKFQKPSEITTRLTNLPITTIYAIYLANPDPKIKGIFESYINKWRQQKPHTTGYDLQEMGLPPGPKYRTILDRLKNAWIDGEVTTVEQEKNLLDELTSDNEEA
jgi:tRNA nucleotidyltransferase (CCA-adding enzyme)